MQTRERAHFARSVFPFIKKKKKKKISIHLPTVGRSSTFSATSLSSLNFCQACYQLSLLLLSTRLQTPTDRAKCHKPEGTSREGNPKEEKINKNEGKKDKNTI